MGRTTVTGCRAQEDPSVEAGSRHTEVVCDLVQYEEVWAAHEDGSQVQPPALPPAQQPDNLIVALPGESHLCSATRSAVSATRSCIPRWMRQELLQAFRCMLRDFSSR